MYVNNNSQVNQTFQAQTTTTAISTNSGNPSQKTTTNKASISDTGLNAYSNFQKIANNYDVANISQNEMSIMVSGLLDNKLISSTDGLYMMAPRSMNLDPDAKFDLLASTRNALAFNKANGGSTEGIKNIESVINILEALQDSSHKV